MKKRVTIIGAGPGGYIAAVRAAQLGADVTVIEEDNVGGTCLNWGCIPSKVMRNTGDLLDRFQRAAEFGVWFGGSASANMRSLLMRQEKVINIQREGIVRLFKEHAIRHLNGHGRISEENSVTVKLPNGESESVGFDSLILALGSQPLPLPTYPFDGRRILSSNHALYLNELPESLLIVGGGVVGCEFAFIFNSLGCRVTVVEALSRVLPLPSIDEDCSKVLQREMKKHKITYMVDHSVEDIKEDGNKLKVTIASLPSDKTPFDRTAEPRTVCVDAVLVSIGRKPNTENIGLKRLGIEMDDRGWIVADEKMTTSAPDVYAIGDVLGPSKIMLAHVASIEGLIAAENIMGGNRTMNYAVVPGVVFTRPEVANVGLTEVQARERGHSARSDSVVFRTLGKAHVIGEIAGQAKIVSDNLNGKILGIHIVGPHAGDIIAEATLAIQMGATVKDLANTIHAHPTLSEIMMEASFKALGEPVHEH